MRSLYREKFVDQLWDVASLDEVAEFWLCLFETAARSYGYSLTITQRLEICLTGFAKSDGSELCKELERRIDGSNLADPEVMLADPNTLVLTSGKSTGDESPPSGLGLAFLGGPPFKGLVAEIRFRVRVRRQRIMGAEGVWIVGVLVIIGELTDNGILVKAVWQSGRSGWQDANMWMTATPQEELLLNGLAEFRASKEVPLVIAKKVFKRAAGSEFARWVVKTVEVPFGRNRLPGLLLRFAGFAIGTVASCWLIDLLIEHKFWSGLVLLGLLLSVPAFLLVFFVFLEAVALFVVRHIQQRRFASYYEMEGFVPFSAHEAAIRLDDPVSRKYLAELRTAGFDLIGGIGVLTKGEFCSVHHVFAAPDGSTYLVLVLTRYSYVHRNSDLRIHCWPQYVALKAYSFLTEGARIESASAFEYGFWKQGVGPNTVVRFIRDVEDPIEFSQNHAAATATFAAGRGLTPTRHERFGDFFRRWELIHEEQRQQYLDRKYTWSDHLRWYLQWPWKEFRG